MELGIYIAGVTQDNHPYVGVSVKGHDFAMNRQREFILNAMREFHHIGVPDESGSVFNTITGEGKLMIAGNGAHMDGLKVLTDYDHRQSFQRDVDQYLKNVTSGFFEDSPTIDGYGTQPELCMILRAAEGSRRFHDVGVSVVDPNSINSRYHGRLEPGKAKLWRVNEMGVYERHEQKLPADTIEQIADGLDAIIDHPTTIGVMLHKGEGGFEMHVRNQME